MKFLVVSVVLISALVSLGEARVFGQCELADALRGFGFPADQIPVWLCICSHESGFNTDATNTVTGDHGIFQISQIYWCNLGDTPGGGCNARCSDFHDDDISDDAACARQIFNEFQGTTGNGFDAWTTYPAYCLGDQSSWIAGC